MHIWKETYSPVWCVLLYESSFASNPDREIIDFEIILIRPFQESGQYWRDCEFICFRFRFSEFLLHFLEFNVLLFCSFKSHIKKRIPRDPMFHM